MVKNIFTKIGLVISSIILALLLSEVAVRIFLPQQLILIRPDIWIPDDPLGWRHAPNLDTRVNTGERTVRLMTDARGYRVGTQRVIDPELRVLALGDSFIAALQVENEQSVAGILEKDLSEVSARRVQVVNTGVGGWGPSHYLLKAREELKRQRYDAVVVFFFIGNDVREQRHERFPPKTRVREHPFQWPRNFTSSEIVYGILSPINEALETRSHLCVFVKNRAWFLLMKFGLNARNFPDIFLKSETTSSKWDITAGLFCDIKKISDQHETPLLLVIIPGEYQVDETLAYDYARAMNIQNDVIDMDQPARLLFPKFEACGLAILDATEPFKQAHGRGFKNLFGKVDTHLSPVGHQLLADLVEPELLKLLKTKP